MRNLNIGPEASSLMFQQLTCGVALGCHLAFDVWVAFVSYHNIFVVTLIMICKNKEAGGARVLA